MKLGGRFMLWVAIGVIATISLVIAFSILNPTPPGSVVISTGPAGSAYMRYAEQYREHFESNGITLKLRESGGAHENLSVLSSPDYDVDIAFITMGSPDYAEEANLQSLGAMFLEPLWFFTTDEDIANRDLASLGSKQISIGPVGSRSNSAARTLFRMFGFTADDISFLELDQHDAADRLSEGTIDAIIMVTNAATPLVQELLGRTGVTLVNFERASAFTALYPQLKKLVVPAGVGSLARNLPAEDVNILAFTAILAIREDVHPAIQTLLLDAALQIHSTPDLFHADGRFPSANVYRIPLSSAASRYYTSGRPFLQRFLPFWLAVLVMQLLVAALPLLGVIYPAVKLMPTAYDWTMRRRIYSLYGELRELEAQLSANLENQNIQNFVTELDDLERRVRNLKVPNTFSNLVFALRSHVNVVRARLPETSKPVPRS